MKYEDLKTLQSFQSDNLDLQKEIFGSDSDLEDDNEELQPIGRATKINYSLLEKPATGNPEKEIGCVDRTSEEIDDEKLKLINQHTLDELFKIIGGKQLTHHKIS